jgi:molybdopterin-biosynthesis enzyme MoeA-like protein
MMELCIGTRSVRGTRMKSNDPRFFDTVVFPMLRLRTRFMAHTTFPGFPSCFSPMSFNRQSSPRTQLLSATILVAQRLRMQSQKNSTVETDVEVRMHKPQHRC